MTKIEADKKPKRVTASQKFSANQKVFYFGMIQDLANRNKGFRFEDLPFLPIAERIVKSIRVYRPEVKGNNAYRNYRKENDADIGFEKFIRGCGDSSKDTVSPA